MRRRPGGVSPNAWNKFIPAPWRKPPANTQWNELNWPRAYPLAHNEMSILCPHFLHDGCGTQPVLFTRVLNPIWTYPDGYSWLRALRDEDKVGLHGALTPTWSETAWWADYVLPMGHGPERHDTHSYETHAGRWLGFRQPVAAGRDGADGPEGPRSPTRPTRERCGRRASSGSSCPGAPTRTGRSGSASTTSRRTGPGEKITLERVLPVDVRELRSGPAREGRRRRPRRRSSTCAVTARSRSRATSTTSTRPRSRTSSDDARCAGVEDTVTKVAVRRRAHAAHRPP